MYALVLFVIENLTRGRTGEMLLLVEDLRRVRTKWRRQFVLVGSQVKGGFTNVADGGLLDNAFWRRNGPQTSVTNNPKLFGLMPNALAGMLENLLNCQLLDARERL